MPKSKGSRVKIALLRLQISRLLVGGASERQIARQVNRSASTVHYHVVEILRSWQREMEGHRNKWIGMQLARIARIEEMTIKEWEESRKGKSTQSAKGRGLALMRGRRATMATPIIEVEQVDRHATTTGNPEYLTKLQWCVSERNKMLGLYHQSDSAPFLVEQEPVVDRYDRARRSILSLVGAQSGEGET